MRAIVVSARGGPEQLVVADVATPVPGPGEIVVDVSVAAVNYLDVYYRNGRYHQSTPFTPGVEGAGRVAALGPGVADLHVGDRVAWVLMPGGYAEQMVIPASRVVRIPDGISDEVAAAGLLHALSAWYLTTKTYPVGPGTTVLVQDAGFGTRLLLVQLAVALGARVIATVKNPWNVPVVRSAGADEVPLIGDGTATELRRLTGSRGVDVVYDGSGRLTFETSLASLRATGMYVQVSETSGPVERFDPERLSEGSFTYARPVLHHHIAERADLVRGAAEVFRWIGNGTLKIRLGRRYPLERAGEAQHMLETHRAYAKPLILPAAGSFEPGGPE